MSAFDVRPETLQALSAELERRDGPLALWWRDDDAVAPTPALDRLLDEAAAVGAPVALAVIPGHASPNFATFLAPHLAAGRVEVIPHGWRHDNHAPHGAKKTEFGVDRPLAARRADAQAGLARLNDLFEGAATPLFTPPWNRVADDLLPELPGLGLRGVSTFNARRSVMAAAGLVRLNTHIDPVDWRQTRGLAPPDRIVDRLTSVLAAQRTGDADPTEPIGLLTHHLIHGPEIWAFLSGLLAHLEERTSLRWRRASEAMRAEPRANGL